MFTATADERDMVIGSLPEAGVIESLGNAVAISVEIIVGDTIAHTEITATVTIAIKNGSRINNLLLIRVTKPNFLSQWCKFFELFV